MICGTGVKKHLFYLVSILAMACFGNTLLNAQYTTASLGGTVVDSSGGVVPGATVTVQNTGTDLTKRMLSGADGSYLFPILPVGTYTLRVEKTGFKTYEQSGILLTVNQAVTQGVVLQLGSVSQQVTVSANAAMVQTQSATLSQLVGQERIVDLPLNGRQAQSLIFLSAGTVNTTNNYCGFNCQGGVYPGAQEAAVNGGGTGSVNYLMDGIENNDTYINMNRPFPNPDALQEFTVQLASLSAEYGGGGNVVNVVTKSGTNQFHGDAFEFVRNGDLNARNFFAPVQDTLKRNQFGGTIGGPIKKDKLFFFGTYQGTRYIETSASQIGFVATAAERQGDFSGLCSSFTGETCNSGAGTQLVNPSTHTPFLNNMIPTSLFSGPSKYFLQKMPLPNGPNGQLTYAGPTLDQPEDQVMGRVDWTLGKNQVSGRYFFADWKDAPDVSAADQNLLAMDPNGNKERVQTLSVNDTYSVSPSTIFNTWFGFTHQTGGVTSGVNYDFPDAGVKMFLAPGVVDIPQLYLSGYFYASSSWPGEFDRGDWRIREAFTQQRGRHEVVLGGEFWHVGAPQRNTFVNGGEFNFTNQLSGNNMADFLLGDATSFFQNAPSGYEYQGYQFDIFGRDNWRVRRNLTLNLGVRSDPYIPYREAHNQLVCYRPGLGPSVRYPNAPIGYLFEGDPGCPYGGAYSNYSNIAPRLGVAYHLGHNTVVRGGAGMYYVRPQLSQANWVTGNPPYTLSFTLNDVAFGDPYGSVNFPDPFPAAYTAGPPGASYVFQLPISAGGFGTDFHAPALASWNVVVEHQFGSNWLASVGYVGDAGYYLSSNQSNSGQEENPAIYIPGNGPNGQPLSSEANTQARRINPKFGNMGVYESNRNSRYNSLQLNLEKRYNHGLSLVANYTWERTLDDFPAPSYEATDPFDIRFDWGVSADNISNVFHLSEVWQIPSHRNGLVGRLANGWEATSILTWQGGFPFPVLSGLDNSFSGVGNDRADFVGAKYSQAVLTGQSHGQMVKEYFKTSLFTFNKIGTFGDIGKNILTGPRYFNTDFALIKDIRVTEQTKIQFRAEAFNVFNNVSFGTPSDSVVNGNFGAITSADPPRILQLSLKFLF